MASEQERKSLTRADFCKRVAVGLAALGLGSLSLEALAQEPEGGALDSPASDFTLRALRRIFETYELPDNDFDPRGDWTHTYTIYSWAPALLWKQNSELALARMRAPAGHLLTGCCNRPGLSGYSHFIQLEADCLANSLGTARSWKATSKMATAVDQPAYLMTEGRATGKSTGRAIEIDQGGGPSRYQLSQPYTLRWCLFEAVQRLAGPATRPLDFTLVDEYDSLFPNQLLYFHNQLRLQLATGPQVLTGYAHTGRGISYPTVYWVDESGRLVLCFSGMDVWVLREENGVAIPYDDKGIKVADFRQQPAGGGR